MKKTNRISGRFECFVSGAIFKIVYLLLVLISFNTYALDVPYLKTILVGASVTLGGIVLLYRVVHFKRFVKMKYIWILFAFLVSYLISMLLNLKYGFMEPLQAMVWMTLQYFILFLKDPAQPREKSQKEFRILSWIFCGYMLCCSVLSFLQLLFNYTEIDFYRQPVKLAGVVWGRLWGVYTDPNYAAVLAIAAAFLGIYLVKCYKSIFVKIFCGINAAFQILYIAFSDSRTGLVCLAAGGAIYAYARLVQLPKLRQKRAAAQAISCITAVCVLCILFVVPKGIKYSYNKIITLSSASPSNPSEGEIQTGQNDKVIGREPELEKDVSNRRFDLWKSGLEIYRLKPVFGVSIFNMVAFAQEQLPSTYLVNNDMGVFNSLHNAFFNVLVGQGIVGFVIIMIFLVLAAVFILKSFLKQKTERHYEDNAKIAALMAIVVSLAVSMLFVGDIIYLNSGAAFLFWNILGILIFHFTAEGRKENHAGS